jgi:hypothetical protein
MGSRNDRASRASTSAHSQVSKRTGTFFQQEEDFNWFHVPIAAPFALKGQDRMLTTIFVFYTAAIGLVVRSVHVCRGPTRESRFRWSLLRWGIDRNERPKCEQAGPYVARFRFSGSWHFRRRDFQSGGEILFPVPAATFNRLSNFTSQFIRSGLGVT